jgi:iron complex outermembrane recepter protein
MKPIFLPCSLLLAALASPVGAQGASTPDAFEEDAEAQRLKDLSIEELMDLEVTIATRSEASLSSTPGAVYVLTGDEIRRAGHSSIPEALRMVPGFYVSHWTSQAWDVTARGFGPGLSLTSSAFLNQLLVMVDGVVVYTPLYAGVWWALQDIDLADVDRIEVIRGPGGSLWGTNATHGVVHVITKSAAETQGGRISTRYSPYDSHMGARYGGSLGANGHWRAWAKGAWYGTLENAQLDFSNDWKILSTGFRADWQQAGKDFTFYTRLYENTNDAYGFDSSLGTIPVVDRKKGYQIFASMADPEEGSRLQAWFSTDQQAQPTFVDLTIDTFDVEYQRELVLSEENRLSFGAGYRIVRSEMRGDDPFFLDFDPHVFHQDIYRVFALDRIAFPTADGELTLGLTLEHNDYTDFEVQPTARYTWNATEDLVVWGAISRAVRTPSLEEDSLGPDSFYVGSHDFDSETLIAYELGARKLLSPRASADLALFFNDYDDLHFEDPEGAQYVLTNEAEGTSWGGELALDLRPIERWTVRSAYSYLHGEYQNKVDGNDLGNEDYYPEHQFNLRSYYDLGADWELDSAVYMVEKMGPAYDIAEYWRVDVRVGWRPTPAFDFYVGVQQLNDAEHSEYSSFNRIERQLYVGLNWNPGASKE